MLWQAGVPVVHRPNLAAFILMALSVSADVCICMVLYYAVEIQIHNQNVRIFHSISFTIF
jgi:hypothetical protein